MKSWHTNSGQVKIGLSSVFVLAGIACGRGTIKTEIPPPAAAAKSPEIVTIKMSFGLKTVSGIEKLGQIDALSLTSKGDLAFLNLNGEGWLYSPKQAKLSQVGVKKAEGEIWRLSISDKNYWSLTSTSLNLNLVEADNTTEKTLFIALSVLGVKSEEIKLLSVNEKQIFIETAKGFIAVESAGAGKDLTASAVAFDVGQLSNKKMIWAQKVGDNFAVMSSNKIGIFDGKKLNFGPVAFGGVEGEIKSASLMIDDKGMPNAEYGVAVLSDKGVSFLPASKEYSPLTSALPAGALPQSGTAPVAGVNSSSVETVNEGVASSAMPATQIPAGTTTQPTADVMAGMPPAAQPPAAQPPAAQPPPAQASTYAGNIRTIIPANCTTGCHIPGGTKSSILLNTLANVKINKAISASAILNGGMPLGANANFKTSPDAVTLVQWLQSSNPQ